MSLLQRLMTHSTLFYDSVCALVVIPYYTWRHVMSEGAKRWDVKLQTVWNVGLAFVGITKKNGGPGNSVRIATGYGLDGPGIESRLGRDSPHLSRPALGPTQSPVKWVPGLFPGVESGRGVTLTPHPLLVPRSKKNQSRAIPLLFLRFLVAYEKCGTYLLRKTTNYLEKCTWYTVQDNLTKNGAFSNFIIAALLRSQPNSKYIK
jgi:hypothetical protein